MTRQTFEWTVDRADPNDRLFADAVATVGPDAAGEFDAVLLGEPYDGAVIGRRGAGEGPAAVREALAGLTTHHFDAGPVDAVGDLGDVAVPDADVAGVQDAVAKTTAVLHDGAAFPVFLGGDNSLTVPNVRPLLSDGRSVGVVSLDAHLDCREVRDGPTSGTPYRQLLDAGLDGLAVVGARHFETSTPYHDYLDDHGGSVVTAEEVGDDPVRAADAAVDALGDVDAVYLSLDVDVLDAALGPGASAPTPGGLTAREVFRLCRLVAADDRLAGFEVVECAPPLDEGGVTAATAARAVAHVLAARGVGR